MTRERLPLFGIVILVLVGGVLIGQTIWQQPQSSSQPVQDSFREWFWQSRSLDLVVQVGLIFGGALGIAALLPGDRENP